MDSSSFHFVQTHVALSDAPSFDSSSLSLRVVSCKRTTSVSLGFAAALARPVSRNVQASRRRALSSLLELCLNFQGAGHSGAYLDGTRIGLQVHLH